MHRRNRLHWRIWLAVLAGLAAFALLGALGWKLLGERPYNTQRQIFAELAGGVLPPVGAGRGELQAALEHWSPRLRSHLALYAADGTPLAATRPDMPPPPLDRPDEDWVRGPGGAAFVMPLPDGRYLLARRMGGSGGGPPLGMLTALLLLALAVGAATYPVARRLTRRLERLQASVERLGGGDLSARVKVEGRDEVAQLAESFNRAAGRIEDLVRAQKSLLANASHELRSPLARVRMAVGMWQTTGDSARADRLRAEVERNIVELDGLIEEILLASRLEATDARSSFAPVDLAALVTDAAAQEQVKVAAQPISVHGDPRLLRRLLRNLLENAERHGGGAGVEVTLAIEKGAAVLCVLDRGPGVPAAERQRIFEPFYRVAGRAESAGGVGLGLALVQRIAQQHGGGVVCEARDGGGSVFRVTLPLAETQQ